MQRRARYIYVNPRGKKLKSKQEAQIYICLLRNDIHRVQWSWFPCSYEELQSLPTSLSVWKRKKKQASLLWHPTPLIHPTFSRCDKRGHLSGAPARGQLSRSTIARRNGDGEGQSSNITFPRGQWNLLFSKLISGGPWQTAIQGHSQWKKSPTHKSYKFKDYLMDQKAEGLHKSI